MTTLTSPPLTLTDFLLLPETKPAQEYIEGVITQKPMPKGRHSRLQGKLCAVINEVAEAAKLAYAFPELRCTFANRSLVPDIAVFSWSRIPFTPAGDVPDNFEVAPDWTIEIVSPEQRAPKVISNILHCLDHGSSLGWFVDLSDRSIINFTPQQQPIIYRGNQTLPLSAILELNLTAEQIFNWLRMEDK
jgi:Uma2 family endonuclease